MQIKNYNPNFCGYKTDFSKKLNRYLSQETRDKGKEKTIVECLSKIMPEKITDKNIKGSGWHGIVYGIDDDYVVKVGRRATPKIGKFVIPKEKPIKELKTYYGNIIARIGNMTIMKNAFKTKNVLPAGLPGRWMSRGEKLAYYNNVYLRHFVSLPQGAYDKIAQDFKTLNTLGKQFDTINPNNFTADGKTIKIVDEITPAKEKNPNTLSKLFKVFVNSYDANTTAEFDYLAIPRRKELIKKLILASEKYELPLYTDINDRRELNLAMRLCDYGHDFTPIERTLSEYRRKYPDIETRLQKISEYIDSINKEDMTTISFYA